MTIYGIATKFGIMMCPYPEISRQSDNAFAFCNNFHTLKKEGKIKQEKKRRNLANF